MTGDTAFAALKHDPRNKPVKAMPRAGESITEWGLAIDAPLTLADPEAHAWDEQADMVIVGLGGAGIAAALQGLEEGLSVIAVDQYDGGGSSAANGGVYYAGGGTSIQREAGVDDDPERMFAYLKNETGNVVSDETLRDFCETSAPTLDWLRGHGAPFQASYYPEKTSYPPLDKFLYHPDSSLAAPYRDMTKPAARGHRVHFRNGNKPWGVGAGMYNPLRQSALAQGMVFHSGAEARQLALDSAGRVIGIRVERFSNPAVRRKHSHYIAKANKWMSMLSATFPGARITIAIGYRYLAKARALEARERISTWIRARKGMVLSAGGFICNPPMVQHFAPEYAPGMPNGTLGDNGSGIMLGVTAGGATELMERVSAWRFLSPPKAWGQGMLVDGRGARFVNEIWYGARIGDEMVERHGGRGYIILDRKLFRKALRDAFAHGVLGFQRDITIVNCLFAATRGKTPEDLARKMGFDPACFTATLADYNRAARGEAADTFHKAPDEMIALEDGPYYAIDASVDARMFPISCMTVGGLKVDERTGAVQSGQGGAVPGLYAAGRNAVGICSNLYVSGLSYSDCIYSGRRAARSIARGI
ncbi:putative 3-oxo-5-alpha-steroid 4-dehydrogenase [Caenibius tardaugens NBRC 16725]|uniref:Putative 3-oxo-5-alpha-steroid 4-dehydrogenase n=1 Tax=Caenibius tardaugens NBRC 16725 TaxID=1219035 RepID=U2YLK9_9SPHN|nr:FAD-binding protein [Caenibius tardaugens]GAD49550.1 putative 3-oxo-5-alpha-steroid 4-dehydrogenase [Caenibius tardaugens NBRC 16725]